MEEVDANRPRARIQEGHSMRVDSKFRCPALYYLPRALAYKFKSSGIQIQVLALYTGTFGCACWDGKSHHSELIENAKRAVISTFRIFAANMPSKFLTRNNMMHNSRYKMLNVIFLSPDSTVQNITRSCNLNI